MCQMFQIIPTHLKNQILVKNYINLFQMTSPIPCDSSNPTYNARKRDAQAQYLGIIKMALRNCIKDINFTVPVQRKRVQRPNEWDKQQSSIC